MVFDNVDVPEAYILSTWLLIESAPRDGSEIVCWRKGWDHPCFLKWKSNNRIPENHSELAHWYFGDPVEYDDYDFAKVDGAPTHWHPLAPLPRE